MGYKLMGRIIESLPLLAMVGLFVLAPRQASAEGQPRPKAVAVAAARADALLNLTNKIYDTQLTTNKTVAELVAANQRLRHAVETALRGAGPTAKPQFDPCGVVHVTIRLETSDLPSQLRAKIHNLPRTICADGVAGEVAALKALGLPPGDVTEQVKAWVETHLKAEGAAKLEHSSTPEKAKQNARRQAMTNAYTALAEKVQSLSLDDGVTVEAFLSQHNELRARVNATLTKANLVRESLDQNRTTYKVEISLPAKALMKPLSLGRYRNGAGAVLSLKQIAIARNNAKRDAQRKLKSRIYGVRLLSGSTAGDLIEKREKLKSAVKKLCRLARIDRVEITQEGLVKMYRSVSTRDLPDEVRRLLSSRAPSRLSVIGGGLPVEPKNAHAEAKPAKKNEEKKKATPSEGITP